MQIFFDLDGTIVDISNRHYFVYKTVVTQFCGSVLEKSKYWELKRSGEEWSQILLFSNVSKHDEAAFLAEFTMHIEAPELLATDTLFPGSVAVLQELRECHELILVSLRRNSSNLNVQLDNLGISNYFSHILSGHSDTKKGVLSKKAAVINASLQVVGGVVIGDTEADVAAARQLGVPSIGITTGIRSRKYLELLNPDYVVDNLQSAQVIVNSLITNT